MGNGGVGIELTWIRWWCRWSFRGGDGKHVRDAGIDVISCDVRGRRIGLDKVGYKRSACSTITLVSPSEMHSLIAASLVRDEHRAWRP